MSVEIPETTPNPDRPCRSCGSAMAPAQDWCVECGTAAAGRLTGRGDRTGFRAAATIITTVLLLVGGAVAASYAALNSKAEQAATAPAPPSGAPTVVAAAPTVTTPPEITPVPPPAPEPAPTPEPAPAPEPTPEPPAPAPAPTPTPAPEPDPEPARDPDEHGPLDLGVDVASIYDPYDSELDSTDPADSYDQNGDTVFTVTTDRVEDMAVGLEFDLETRQEVEKVYFRTTTPGFTVEIYGAEGSLPPDILDNRWKQLAGLRAAGAAKGSDGLVKLEFEPGRFRHIVLWITKPPPAEGEEGQPGSDSATVGFSEVRILD
ncbi:MAG: hypothetical protein WKF96_09875 [Solirubrobacteraceae bacterium]